MTNGKACKQCGEIGKPTRQKYSKSNNKYYLLSICKECENYNSREYQKSHLEKYRDYNKRSYLNKVGILSRQSPLNSDPEITKEKKRISVANWQKTNPDRIKQIRLRQKQNGNDKAKSARRRSRKKQACPPWVDHEKLKLIYQSCPAGYHVDHIIPLTSDLVCGLHVPENLQYLLAIENIKKGNKICHI